MSKEHLKGPCDSSYMPQCAKWWTCICGKPAQRKVQEVIFDDDPTGWRKVVMGGIGNRALARHPLTSYVCLDCFKYIMGIKYDGRIL